MGQRLATLVLLTMPLGGCSKLYDPGNLPNATDAPVPPTDVARDQLMLTDVSPSAVYEGQGDGGSRAALVVIRGSNIAPDAVVEIVPAAGQAMFTAGTPMVAPSFSFIAVPLTILAETALTSDVRLNITVTQPIEGGGTVSQSLTEKLTIRALPELDKDTIFAPGNVANTMQLKPLYSKIDLSQNPLIDWVGAQRVELRATSSITVAELRANGGNANTTTAGVAGPGGCPGGGPAQVGQCPPSGGGPGNSGDLLQAGGGGGAGFSAMGIPGAGNGGGTAGGRVGSPQIATYEGFGTNFANKAGGGGGGGNIGLGTTGGGGGGGGGVLELTAGGNVQAGTLTAAGGNGGTVGGQGGGGGGAGGIIMLRSGGMLTAGTANVPGGAGGTSTPNGGAGSPGRVRWDAAIQDLPPPGTTPVSPHRGPAYAMDTPLIFNQKEPAITLYGTANDSFDIHVTDEEGTQRASGDGTFTSTSVIIRPTLQPGYNIVCVTLNGGQKGTPEADKCIEVAFLP